MVKLTKEEKEMLFDLVFLGNWLINSQRLPDAQIEKYEKLTNKIGKLFETSMGIQTPYGDLYDFYLDKLFPYVDHYEKQSCFAVVAEKLAEKDFPVDPNATDYFDSLHMQLDVAYIYEKQLTENGVSILTIDVPNLDDLLEVCRQRYRKNKSVLL